jgi:hypothetical protein
VGPQRASDQDRRPAYRRPNPLAVFLNFPYDDQFRKLYLGYIAGICSFGLVPRTTLEIPGGERRLNRIVDLIRGCRYSFHDLSRVELDLRRPRTPRFNMPFELGLAVMAAIEHPAQHTWCVFESKARRAQKSLSDLGGIDGLFRELLNALVGVKRQPTVHQMMSVYETLEESCPGIMAKSGNQLSVWSASVCGYGRLFE